MKKTQVLITIAALLFLASAFFSLNPALAHENEQEHHEELHEDGTCEHAMEMIEHHNALGHTMCEDHNQFPRG